MVGCFLFEEEEEKKKYNLPAKSTKDQEFTPCYLHPGACSQTRSPLHLPPGNFSAL